MKRNDSKRKEKKAGENFKPGIVIIDRKGELYKASSTYLKDKKVYVFNPWNA